MERQGDQETFLIDESQLKCRSKSSTTAKNRGETNETTSILDNLKPVTIAALNEMDKDTSDEHTSDADSDKSIGEEDLIVRRQMRKKKLLLRKRKISQKDMSKIRQSYPANEEKSMSSSSCVDALDRAKQEANAADQQVPSTSGPSGSNKFSGALSRNVAAVSTAAIQSGDSSHDEDDSDIAGDVNIIRVEGASTVTSDLGKLNFPLVLILPI